MWGDCMEYGMQSIILLYKMALDLEENLLCRRTSPSEGGEKADNGSRHTSAGDKTYSMQ